MSIECSVGRDLVSQLREVLERHPNDSGIVYCIRRARTEEIAAVLTELGHAALPYHAGLSDEQRHANQDAFINERAKIVVATVAFGMGIDQSDVRYVIHAATPKSLESYQQESGRAGRDGLAAECWLLYTGSDFQTWRKLQSELPPQAYEIAMTVLAGIENYCIGVACRHQAIVRYFGQELPSENCGACDVCLAEVEVVADALVLSQKILSCVARLNEGFGAEYTAQVLVGSHEQRILDRGHNQLSTWSLLREHDKQAIRGWIDQLVSQNFLEKFGEFSVLRLTAEGRGCCAAERCRGFSGRPPRRASSRASTSIPGKASIAVCSRRSARFRRGQAESAGSAAVRRVRRCDASRPGPRAAVDARLSPGHPRHRGEEGGPIRPRSIAGNCRVL